MGYSGDRDMYCGKCKKTMRFVRCPRCNGKGGGAMSQCRHCANTGYKCSAAPSDAYHG